MIFAIYQFFCRVFKSLSDTERIHFFIDTALYAAILFFVPYRLYCNAMFYRDPETSVVLGILLGACVSAVLLEMVTVYMTKLVPDIMNMHRILDTWSKKNGLDTPQPQPQRPRTGQPMQPVQPMQPAQPMQPVQPMQPNYANPQPPVRQAPAGKWYCTGCGQENPTTCEVCMKCGLVRFIPH